MKEVWKAIPGREGYYAASNKGRIKSVDRVIVTEEGVYRRLASRIIRLRKNNKGYLICNLSQEGKWERVFVHALVASAFRGRCPTGHQVRHRDGIQANCWATNLRYGTPRQNEADKIRHGTVARGERCGTSKLKKRQIIEIRRQYAAGGVTQRELGDQYGVSGRAIGLAVNHESWAWL